MYSALTAFVNAAQLKLMFSLLTCFNMSTQRTRLCLLPWRRPHRPRKHEAGSCMYERLRDDVNRLLSNDQDDTNIVWHLIDIWTTTTLIGELAVRSLSGASVCGWKSGLSKCQRRHAMAGKKLIWRRETSRRFILLINATQKPPNNGKYHYKYHRMMVLTTHLYTGILNILLDCLDNGWPWITLVRESRSYNDYPNFF